MPGSLRISIEVIVVNAESWMNFNPATSAAGCQPLPHHYRVSCKTNRSRHVISDIAVCPSSRLSWQHIQACLLLHVEQTQVPRLTTLRVFWKKLSSARVSEGRASGPIDLPASTRANTKRIAGNIVESCSFSKDSLTIWGGKQVMWEACSCQHWDSVLRGCCLSLSLAQLVTWETGASNVCLRLPAAQAAPLFQSLLCLFIYHFQSSGVNIGTEGE